MQSEQIWQTVLGQLQMEMPRTTFDTWVRETALVTHEDGTFVVGAPNAYAKDWLENRLTSSVSVSTNGFFVFGNLSGSRPTTTAIGT